MLIVKPGFSLAYKAMASRSMCFFCFLFVPLLPLGMTDAWKPPFNAIYQFGDSFSDTGNLIRENSKSRCSSLPYGETFFHRPTGRCSDGLLMVDFIAKSFQLPLLNPYLDKDANFIHGVNFAVAGATALDTSVLAAKNITVLNTNSSLSVQLGWFRTHLKSTCSSKAECKHRLRKTLFLLGEIGANDYIYALLGGKSIQDLYNVVPDVVQFIKDAVNESFSLDVLHICLSISFASNDTSKYDEFKCIKIVNEFFKYHNRKLQEAVEELQHQNPSVSISYGDLYSAFTWLLQNATSLGFEKDGVLKACCGVGNNAYNYDIDRLCGTGGVAACREPRKRVSWDGLHLTQQAYKYLAGWMIKHNIGSG